MTKVSAVIIKKIPQLDEVLELPANADVPIYDPATGITGRIKAALLKGGEEIKTNWTSTTPYLIDAVVEFQLKLWKSLHGTELLPNIGNTPVEGSNWTEVSKSSGNGYGYWSAGVFTQDPSMVIRSGGLFLLDNTKVTFPFNSTDFETEYNAGIWVQLAGSGGGSNAYSDSKSIIGGLNGFKLRYDRPVILSSINVDATKVTNVLIGKNGATPSTFTLPYTIASGDVIEFALTNIEPTYTYLTLNGTYND